MYGVYVYEGGCQIHELWIALGTAQTREKSGMARRDHITGEGGGPRGGPGRRVWHHLNPRIGGLRGVPETLSQLVDPGGVGG